MWRQRQQHYMVLQLVFDPRDNIADSVIFAGLQVPGFIASSLLLIVIPMVVLAKKQIEMSIKCATEEMAQRKIRVG